MKVFITGASGFIGYNLATTLALRGHEVSVLLRNLSVSTEFGAKGIKVIRGDLFRTDALLSGMENCDWVFHLAAFTRPVSGDLSLPFRTNVTGTRNVLESAKAKSVKKIVLTSTAGTFSYSADGLPVDETRIPSREYHTEYERTKALSEKAASEFSAGGMEVVTVNPTRVYGPGRLTLSNSVTRIIKLYGQGLWRIMPGDGSATGNYVYIADVVNGLILAATYGKGGERYILGGENLSYKDFFDILGEIYGHRRKLVPLSESSMKHLSRIAGLYARLTKRPPFITDAWISRYLKDWIVSSDKAVSQINYSITPFREGAAETIRWLKTGKQYEN